MPAAFDLAAPAFHADPFPTLARMRDEGPLIRMKVPIIGTCWMVTTHEMSASVMKDADRLVREPGRAGRRFHAGMTWWMPRSIRLLADNMLGKDDPEHKRLRGLVDQAFQRRSVDSMNDRITAVADNLLDRMEQGNDADIMRDFARDLPLSVICHLLGLPERDHERFKDWMRPLSSITGAYGLAAAVPGILRMLRYLRGAIEEARRKPGGGLISALVEAEVAGGRLSDDELLAMVVLLFGAGHETTTHLIAGGALLLMTHPEALERIRDDDSALPGAVEECLRHYTPVQTTKPRYAIADMELGGQAVSRGDTVLPFIACANSDPAKFAEPELFDIMRRPNPHLSLAAGPHFCLGFQLARAEARISFERLFRRFANMRLTLPAASLEWRRRFGIRSLVALPVTL